MISIMYDPGKFPALLAENEKAKFSRKAKLYRRNGGVPQEGNLDDHLKQYVIHVNELIPNGDFDGLAVIDFESWRPIFRQNFGALQPYKDVSFEIERSRHPLWPQAKVEAVVS